MPLQLAIGRQCMVCSNRSVSSQPRERQYIGGGLWQFEQRGVAEQHAVQFKTPAHLVLERYPRIAVLLCQYYCMYNIQYNIL